MAVELLEGVRDPVSMLGQCGVVFVAWSEGWQSRDRDIPSDPDLYWCTWQNHEPDDLDLYENAEFEALADALRWHRSAHVLVRPQWDSGRHYMATDEPPEKWRVTPND